MEKMQYEAKLTGVQPTSLGTRLTFSDYDPKVSNLSTVNLHMQLPQGVILESAHTGKYLVTIEVTPITDTEG